MKKSSLIFMFVVVAVSTTTFSTDSEALRSFPETRVSHCFHEVNGQLEPLPYAMNIGPGQACPPVPSSAWGHNKTTPLDHDCREVIRQGMI